MNSVWPAVWLSLRVALMATALVALVAVPLAWLLSRRRFVGKSALEALIAVPLVLPPTVVGYLILLVMGSRGWVGQYLHRELGYSIIFRFEGAVLAAAVVALPMLYLPAKAAFAAIDPELEDIARLLGATRSRLFFRISLPLAARGIGSGLVLAFARALGEFGATLMVFGWQSGRQTIPIWIYAHFEQGELARAAPAVIVLLALSLLLVGLYNASGAGGRIRL
jgi:molybdate transport system permease protein